jgi:hypothetical protein
VRREDDRKGFAHLRVEMGEQFLGQDDPGAVADLGDLEGGVHTGVITFVFVWGKGFAARAAHGGCGAVVGVRIE